MSERVGVGRRKVELTNLDKPLFARPLLRKRRIVDYYRRIAGLMLPHIERRPLTLQRFPEGLSGYGFYQQNRADYFPEWVETVRTRRRDQSGETVQHILCNERAAIVYLANQDTIAFHSWLSRTPQLDQPDRLVFDLDPPGRDFARVARAARQVGELMDALGLEPYLMTTGSRGLHVVAPLTPETGFDEVRSVARRMARLLAQRHHEELTVEQRKAKRRGRLYLDISRNAFGQTAIAAYSLRALAGAPVATPLAWNELGRTVTSAQAYNLGNIFRRLGQKSDPWRAMRKHAAAIERASNRLEKVEQDR